MISTQKVSNLQSQWPLRSVWKKVGMGLVMMMVVVRARTRHRVDGLREGSTHVRRVGVGGGCRWGSGGPPARGYNRDGPRRRR